MRGEQGKFWEYHDALYAEQSKLDGAELLTRARALNLDEKSFQSCLNSGKFKSKIEADLEQGRKVGVAGTPGFFVNGVFLSGAVPPADFEKSSISNWPCSAPRIHRSDCGTPLAPSAKCLARRMETANVSEGVMRSE